MDIYEFASFSNVNIGIPAILSRFGYLRIYIILKPASHSFSIFKVLDIYEFTSFSNNDTFCYFIIWFWISTNLHHSQTPPDPHNSPLSFGYLRIYIILKLLVQLLFSSAGFGYLRIYIILKLDYGNLAGLHSFGYLRIYIILKPTISVLHAGRCFGAIRNYTILKLYLENEDGEDCFRTIRNYTILKL